MKNINISDLKLNKIEYSYNLSEKFEQLSDVYNFNLAEILKNIFEKKHKNYYVHRTSTNMSNFRSIHLELTVKEELNIKLPDIEIIVNIEQESNKPINLDEII